jgi:hypothetical protein
MCVHAIGGDACRHATARLARRRAPLRRSLLLIVALLAVALLGTRPSEAQAEGMDLVTVEGEALRAGGDRFVAYGFNYGFGDHEGTLSYFDRPGRQGLQRIRGDFEEARRMGANTLRIYLEIGQFMNSPTEPRPRALLAFERVLRLAEEKGLYLDVTGNLAWRPDHRDAWYELLPERERWRVQARFWRAVAARGRPFESVLCYELTSEPAVPSRASDSYYFGSLGGYDFAQYVVRDPAGRDRYAVARDWTGELARAVRSRDPRHPVSIGLLPFTGQPFDPVNVAAELDLVIVHEYARDGQAQRSIDLVRHFASQGKPVLLGETFELEAGPETQREFLLGSRPYLDGFLSFYDGRQPSEVEDGDLSDSFYEANLRHFLDLRPSLLE